MTFTRLLICAGLYFAILFVTFVIDDLIEDFSDEPGTTETVYPYAPIEIVNQLIEKHGGIINN